MTPIHNIQTLIERIARLRVLIVGDLMLDRYLTGTVSRISPEAPVPVVALTQSESRLGGAANVALNVAALGARVHMCGVVGRDRDGAELIRQLDAADFDTSGVLSSPDRPTTVKTRVLAQHQQLLRIDEEITTDLNVDESDALLRHYRGLLDEHSINVVIFQDYNKGVLTKDGIRQMTALAHQRNILTVVDPKFHHFFDYRAVSLFKPNLREVRDALPFEIAIRTEDLDHAADYLRERLQHQYTMITLGDRGVYFHDGERGAILPTHPRQIADVCGAGDTVISVAAVALAAGCPLSEVAKLANLAGGQVCERVGVVPVDLAQFIRESSLVGYKNSSAR